MTRDQALAQLRHLYQQLWDGIIPGSTLGQRSVAIEMLGPVISCLELGTKCRTEYIVYYSADPLPLGSPLEYFTEATSHVADLVGTFTAADEYEAIGWAAGSAREQWGVLGAGGYFAAFPVGDNDKSPQESGEKTER